RLWLWTHASALAMARDAQASASTSQTIVWLAAALIAAGALFLGLRRPAPATGSQPALAAPVPSSTPAAPGATVPATGGDVSGFGSTVQAAVPPPPAGRPAN